MIDIHYLFDLYCMEMFIQLIRALMKREMSGQTSRINRGIRRSIKMECLFQYSAQVSSFQTEPPTTTNQYMDMQFLCQLFAASSNMLININVLITCSNI